MRLGREWSLRTPSRAPRARFPQVLRALAADGTLRLAGAAALLRRAGSAPRAAFSGKHRTRPSSLSSASTASGGKSGIYIYIWTHRYMQTSGTRAVWGCCSTGRRWGGGGIKIRHEAVLKIASGRWEVRHAAPRRAGRERGAGGGSARPGPGSSSAAL